MRNFVLTALTAALVSAEYQNIFIEMNGQTYVKHFRSQDWDSITTHSNGTAANVGNNNSMLIKDQAWDGQEYAFKPRLRGGAMQFDVDLSKVECGCVAGVYAVKLDDFGCSENSLTTDRPQCQSVDVMQANPYGFQMSAHPCNNGTCDARSMCDYKMREQGIETYGEGAYGPDGFMIDTNRAFTVKTEFLSDSSYQSLWGIRTRITQDGQEIELLADCSDYIEGLNSAIEANMGYVVSAWDNREMNTEQADFECQDSCPQPASSCDGAVNSVSNFQFFEWGYNEDKPEPSPEPSPQPADFEGFVAESNWYGGSWEFFVKGLDNRDLSTSGTEITIGENNRAFITDYAYDNDVYWGYKHEYLGGSVEFDVDVSETSCACAAGVYLAQLNNEECSWNPMDADVTPQCASIDLMEANNSGFNTQSSPCEFGTCEFESQCRRKASDNDAMAYGLGSDYIIDTSKSYHVKTRFWTYTTAEGQAAQDADSYSELYAITTYVTQEGSYPTINDRPREITIDQDCEGYLDGLTGRMKDLTMGISSYSVGQDNEIADNECVDVCSESTTKISNIVWKSHVATTVKTDCDEEWQWDEIFELYFYNDCQGRGDTDCGHWFYSYENEGVYWVSCETYQQWLDDMDSQLIIDGVAQSLEQCGQGCTECHEAHYENFPEEIVYECTDYTVYKYGNICTPNNKWNEDKCMTSSTGFCHKSYPYGDPDKMRSTDAACRTLPSEYVENDFTFGSRDCWSPTGGLCNYGCEGTCHNSWIASAEARWLDSSAMCRCKL